MGVLCVLTYRRLCPGSAEVASATFPISCCFSFSVSAHKFLFHVCSRCLTPPAGVCQCIYGRQLWLEVTGPRCLHSTWKVSSCPVVDYGPLRKQESLFAFPIKGIWGIFEKGKQVGISVPML